MKTKFRLFRNTVMLILAIGMASCEGDQGEIGPEGAQGIAGTAGATGANGTGFDELTQYGNIKITMAGKRSDGDAFTETMDFIYMPASGISNNSIAYNYNETTNFNIGRENKGKIASMGRTEDGGNKNNVWFDFTKTEDGFTFERFVIYADVVTPDFKTFEVNYNNGSWNEGFEMEISNYNYNTSTGKLTFDFTHTISAESNGTGFELVVTGKVDVIVFEGEAIIG